jgi:uncharacterized membrane protein
MKYLVLLLLITSCASRKVAIVKEETKITIDSTAIVKTDSISTINKNVYFTENSTELEIKPLNDSLPIVIDGTSYFNVVLRYKKYNKVLSNNISNIVHKSESKRVSKSKQETKNIKEKHIDKKVNNFVYLWLLLIPIGMYIYRQLKNKFLL